MSDLEEPAAAAPGAAADPAAALAERVAAFRRRQVVVDYANRGVSTPEIAARLGIPEHEARKRLREALARLLPESPEVFAALQMSRLNEALLVAFSAMAEMGLKAVDRVLRILRALDRLHAGARALLRPAAAEASPAAQAERSPAQAPQAVGARNQDAAQPFEKSQNGSQESDLAAVGRAPSTPAGPPGETASRRSPGAAAAAASGGRDAGLPREAADRKADRPNVPGSLASTDALAAVWLSLCEALRDDPSPADLPDDGVSVDALLAAIA